MTDTSITDLVFGSNATGMQARFSSYKDSDYTTADAQVILDSIVHPEMRMVIDRVQSQVRDGKAMVRYSSFDDPQSFRAYTEGYVLGNMNRDRCLLFTDWAVREGFLGTFVKLLELASPGYHSPSLGIGEITLERTPQ